jgi:hypothetical protein
MLCTDSQEMLVLSSTIDRATTGEQMGELVPEIMYTLSYEIGSEVAIDMEQGHKYTHVQACARTRTRTHIQVHRWNTYTDTKDRERNREREKHNRKTHAEIHVDRQTKPHIFTYEETHCHSQHSERKLLVNFQIFRSVFVCLFINHSTDPCMGRFTHWM